jgi:ABC-type Fe3+/spermidine/putrescine transport system ATPase subunit
LEQFDSPSALYHRPATPRIARFTGAANLFDGVLVTSGRLETDFGTLEVLPPRCHEIGDRVLAMIRGESIEMAPHVEAGEGLAGVVCSADFSGASVSYSIAVGDVRLKVEEHSTRSITPGTPVRLTLPRDRIWIFKRGAMDRKFDVAKPHTAAEKMGETR